jgi:hypothetical protein
MSRRSSRRSRWLVPLAVVVAAAACTDRGPAERVAVMDSAGVVIVESYAPAWAGVGWTVAQPPLLELGVVEGPAEYQFTSIEGVVRLPDGRIVVADGGAREIRWFDGEGRFLSSTGRRGDAPGEYRQINALGYGPGDSVWVYDYRNRRFTILTADGELARTMTLGPTLSNVAAVGRLADGSFVVREYWSAAAMHSPEIRLGLSRDPAAVARISADGSELDTLGLFPGREVFIGTEGGRGVMSAPLFARTTSAAVLGSDAVVGDQETFEFGLYAADGSLRRLVRLPQMDLSLSESDIERATEERLAAEPPGRRAMWRAHLEAMAVPETRPAYGRLLPDAAGNLWVAGSSFPSQEPAVWLVFDRDGQLLGPVSVPRRFRVQAIGGDWLLGVWRDEIDVERVRLYSLVKANSQQEAQ